MKRLLSLLALLNFAAHAQVTFRLTAVPANTPANAIIYMVGSFNNWNPSSPAHALAYNAADGSYQLTLPAGTGVLEYKFTRGSWATVETSATNGAVPNRRYAFDGGSTPVLGQVLNWEDVAGGTPGGRAIDGGGQRARHLHRVCHAAAGPHPARVAVFAPRLRQQRAALPGAVYAGRAERV